MYNNCPYLLALLHRYKVVGGKVEEVLYVHDVTITGRLTRARPNTARSQTHAVGHPQTKL